MQTSVHQAVLVEEIMLVLDPQPGKRYLDGTLGGATHTEALLKRSAPDGIVCSFDVDPEAIKRAYARLAAYLDRWQPIEANFRDMAQEMRQRHQAPFDGVLLDLGLSSDELIDPEKGISFLQDGPLDMRLGPKANEDGLTAAGILNGWSEHDLRKMLEVFGEERFARQIANAIVKTRKEKPLETTQALVALIRETVPAFYEKGRIHPATRTFQALRIAVNDELQALKEAIQGAYDVLAPGGRCAIITFHSLEDRIVKLAFRETDKWSLFNKRPIVPSEAELSQNPRSRSAKLRVAIKK